MKYHLVILGCQMNYADAERVQSIMAKMGYEWTDVEEEANVIGIIACSVRQKAIDKVYYQISKWNKWKNKKNLITFASGCILPKDRERFLKLFDIIFDMKELAMFPAMLSQYGVTTPVSNSPIIYDEEILKRAQPATPAEKLGFTDNSQISMVKAAPQAWEVEPLYNSSFEAFIPIQNGCNKFCTFCAVPYTRGREVSRPSEDIIDEVEKLIAHDYKSITLLGQNVNSYGLDKKGEELSFAQLLEKIGELADNSGKDVWIYFTSPHPRDMTRDVIEAIAKYRSLAKQIHLPVQSGDDKVLIKMNRKHSMERYDEVEKLIAHDYKSITLLGQNVNSYGLDKKGEELSFAQLLEKIGELADNSGKEVWIYFTSPHPRDMTRDVIETIAKCRSLAKQIHLPVQSGDDKVLIKMNRKHSMERYDEVVGWVRELLPTATLFTDIIVGFTGETDEQFENTRETVRKYRYNMAYVAMYSPRPGAASYAWEEDIDHEVKKERHAILTEDLNEVAAELTKDLVGKTMRLLVRGKDRKEGYLSGHTEGRLVGRFASDDESLFGTFVDVKVTSVRPFSMEGELVKELVS